MKLFSKHIYMLLRSRDIFCLSEHTEQSNLIAPGPMDFFPFPSDSFFHRQLYTNSCITDANGVPGLWAGVISGVCLLKVLNVGFGCHYQSNYFLLNNLLIK